MSLNTKTGIPEKQRILPPGGQLYLFLDGVRVVIKRRILILGSGYGLLLAAKLVLAGHAVVLVGHPAEVARLNAEGARIRLRRKGGAGLIEVSTRTAVGTLSAVGAADVDLDGFDLVVFAMQEPAFAAPDIGRLVRAISGAGLPCLSVMNMPLPPYLARVLGRVPPELAACYSAAALWDGFPPELMSACSPDPQAYRPEDGPSNLLHVALPTNFKAAAFPSPAHTRLLRQFEDDIEAIRLEHEGARIELPVKLKLFDDPLIPLAKWPMLIAGNYRCMTDDGIRSIRDAVHRDPDAARSIYEWVAGLCRHIGIAGENLVPFGKYATAALDLERPSSAARALVAGATAIERVDMLVRAIAAQHGMANPSLDGQIALVDRLLARNAEAG